MSRFAFIVFAVVFLSTSHLTALPFNLYSSRTNGFMGFGKPDIVDGCISIDNKTIADSIILCDSIVSPYKFQITLRIANLHNSENKTYPAIDASGKTHKISNPEWGVVFNYTAPNNYYAVTLSANNSNPFDILDKRSLTCSLIKVENGNRKELASQSLTNDVNLYEGINLISLVVKQSNISVKIGNKTLNPILSAQINDLQNAKVGILSGPGSKVAVERFIIKHQQDPTSSLITNWTEQAINRHLSTGTDPNEGIWLYLDRIIDDKQLKLGGRYKLALIATPSGYDIIYISGAEVNASKWITGMIKGRLTKTSFANHYDLIWYDSNFAPFTTDVNATIDAASIITFHFPIHNTQLRFAKQLQH